MSSKLNVLQHADCVDLSCDVVLVNSARWRLKLLGGQPSVALQDCGLNALVILGLCITSTFWQAAGAKKPA